MRIRAARVCRSTIALMALLVCSCTTLGGLGVQAPRFGVASDQPSQFRLLGPTLQQPLGSASLRLYARVENPNPVGLTLSRVVGRLTLEGIEAADAEFPLGLPLAAGASAVVPLDLSIGFANLPGLADVLSRAAANGDVAYGLRGTIQVDAGVLGQPVFGPMMLLEGTVSVRR